jgi:hypothetical protein
VSAIERAPRQAAVARTLNDLEHGTIAAGLDHLYQYYAAGQAAQLSHRRHHAPGVRQSSEVIGHRRELHQGIWRRPFPTSTSTPSAIALATGSRALGAGLPGHHRRATVQRMAPGHGDRLWPYARTLLRRSRRRVRSSASLLGRVDPYGVYVKVPRRPSGRPASIRVTARDEGRRFEVTATR